jgi:DHA1 family bicyclomycin/chloramphenicol resistance-like MFS transporter
MSDSRASSSPPPYTDTSTAGLLAVVRGRPLHPVVFVVVLGALTALGPFTMDLYLPAFPMVAADLDTSAAMVQVTLTATAVGLGIGQIIVGPLSDATGRRIPLMSATTLHVVCSALIVVAPTVELVVLARFGQGCGAAAGAVVASAMVRDVFGGLRLVRIAARIALVNGAAPIIAPVIGSQLLLVTTWRGVFAILAVFGLAVLIAAALLLPETRPRARRAESTTTARARIAILLADRVYVGTVLVSSMVFAAIVSYLSTSPFVFQEEFGLSAQEFGMLFAVCAIGLLIATQLAARLMRRFQPAMLLGVALPVLLLSGVGFVVVALSGGGWPWALLAGFGLVALHGFVNPCTGVLILADHPNESGTAVALSGFVNSVVGGSLSLLPALVGVGMLSLGVTVVVAATIAMIILWVVVRPGQVPPLPVA